MYMRMIVDFVTCVTLHWIAGLSPADAPRRPAPTHHPAAQPQSPVASQPRPAAAHTTHAPGRAARQGNTTIVAAAPALAVSQ